MRIVIVGGGEVGSALAQGAGGAARGRRHRSRAPPSPTVFERSTSSSLPAAAPAPRCSRRAGIERADVFVACTGLDEVNIVACALANRLGKPDTICFVSRADFLGTSRRRRPRRIRHQPHRLARGSARRRHRAHRHRPRRDRRRGVRRRGGAAARVPARGRLAADRDAARRPAPAARLAHRRGQAQRRACSCRAATPSCRPATR